MTEPKSSQGQGSEGSEPCCWSLCSKKRSWQGVAGKIGGPSSPAGWRPSVGGRGIWELLAPWSPCWHTTSQPRRSLDSDKHLWPGAPKGWIQTQTCHCWLRPWASLRTSLSCSAKGWGRLVGCWWAAELCVQGGRPAAEGTAISTSAPLLLFSCLFHRALWLCSQGNKTSELLKRPLLQSLATAESLLPKAG